MVIEELGLLRFTFRMSIELLGSVRSNSNNAGRGANFNFDLTMSDSGGEPKTSQQEEASQPESQSQSKQGTYLTCVSVFPLLSFK